MFHLLLLYFTCICDTQVDQTKNSKSNVESFKQTGNQKTDSKILALLLTGFVTLAGH